MSVKSRLERLQKNLRPVDGLVIIDDSPNPQCKFRRSDCPKDCVYKFPTTCWYKKKYPYRPMTIILGYLPDDEE